MVACLTASWVVAQAVPSPAFAFLLKTQRELTITALQQAIARGDENIGPIPMSFVDNDEGLQADDPLLRALWQRLETGPVSQQSILSLLQETSLQRQREQAYGASAQRFAEIGAAPTPTTTLQWSRLGPQSALSEWNGSFYDGLDGGRVATVRADPTNPATIYIGAIGGGIWKTPDITLANPAWTPITDSLGTMFIGSFDIDPTDSNTLHVGLGDFWEGNPGGVMVTTHDGGATWSAPRPLTVQLNGTSVKAVNIRTVKIDPNDNHNILVAADVGLFRSTDGGDTYVPVDLPNTAPYGSDLEGTFSIVYTGTSEGGSTFLVSGNYACPGTFPPSFNQPTTGFFVLKCPDPLTTGNLGDIWKSTDSGATWTSTRVAGALPTPLEPGAPVAPPTPPNPPVPAEMGRINLTAIPGAASADTAVVYALGGNQNGARTLAVLKSVDGGATWTIKTNGALSLPTNPTPGATGGDCLTMDIGHGQSQYDLAIAVDPGDPDNVIIGGNLCGARTVDGGDTWQMASDWLAFGGAEGPLPYVHADWHNALIVRHDGQAITLAAGDGGVFTSFDLFTAHRGADVHWFDGNVGLDTHLPYSVGSGDPVLGTAQIVLAGMQDNGTRFRVSQTEAYLSNLPLAWNQIQGGDGFGTAVASDSKGMRVTAWGVANGGRRFCRVSAGIECSRAARVVNGIENRSWYPSNPRLPQGDANSGFGVRYALTYDDAGSVITNSINNLWKISTLPGNLSEITRLTTAPPPPGAGGYVGCGTTNVRGIRAGGPVASPFTYEIGGKSARVYGLPLGAAAQQGGCFAVIVDTGDPNGVVSVFTPKTVLGTGTEQVAGTASITFPRDPSHLGGSDITQTYIVSSIADFLAVPATNPATPIPAAIGHVFLTNDGGTTWTPLHGDPGFELPNVRVWVVRFDPSDPTDQTLYAGTDLGLYRTTDLGKTWTRYGDNLPMVRIQDLFISLNGSLLRVAVYGRGIWEIYPRSDGAGGATGNGDFDGNGIIDFLDIANLTNRLTVTPAITELPVYDSEMNMKETTAATTLDDDDLNALLAKFGGVP